MKQKLLNLTRLRSLVLLAVIAFLGAGQAWANEGDELAICQGTGSGYGTRRTLTDSHNVGWVLASGQSGYLGANSSTNHDKVKPTATDLPVVKAVKPDATTSTTGYYFYYTTTAVANVGSIEFSYTGNSGNNSATAYVVVGDELSVSGGDAYEIIELSSTSTTEQNASLGTSGTFTYTFNETQTDARFYGFIIVTSSYKRLTAGTIKLIEGATNNTPTCATPTFSPAEGAVVSGTTVTISSTEGATIYYTTNGSKPTTSSSVYSEPIEITSATTIKAFATKTDYNDSEVATATYTIKPVVTGYTIDFENDVDDYVDWTFTNIGTSNTAITAHGGNKYGANINDSGNGVATCSIQTNETIALPGTFTCYVSKTSGNTTASTWTLAVSEDGTTWTNVDTQSAQSMGQGTWVEFTANLEIYSDVYVRLSYGNSSAIRAIDDISITMRDPNAKITPTVTIDATGLTADLAGSTNVSAGTITATVTSGETTITTPAVTWSSSNTGVATVNASTGAVTLLAVGTTNLIASFAGNDDYNEASASYELTVVDTYAKGGLNNPYTVAEAIAAYDAAGADIAGVYVTGIVSEIVDAYNSSYHNISYNISADGSTTGTQLEAFRGKSYNGENFTSADDIQVGDEVVLYGTITYYATNSIYELATGNQLVSLNRAKQDPTIVVNSTETVTYGNTFTVDDTMIEGGEITVTSSNTAVATVSGLVITPVAVGTTTITVATAESTSYNAGSDTFTLTVTAPEGSTTAPSSETTTTFDFSQNGWGLLTASSSLNGEYTKGTQTVTISGTGYYYGSKALLLGKSGATITLPAFDKPVTQIDVVGVDGASGSVKQNIYVGEDAVSTETTGANNVINSYTIASDKQAAGTRYTFKVTSSHNTQIARIVVHMSQAPSTTVQLNTSGYGTFCSVNPMDFSTAEGYTAWRITSIDMDGTTGTINFEKITEAIKGGQGVLLYNKDAGGVKTNATINFADGTTVFSNSENLLVGTTAPTYVTADQYFGLSGSNFVKVNEGVVPIGKALLPASKVPADGNAKTFTFIFNDTETGIKTVEHVSAEEAAEIFNLAGQRLQKAQRGVNIINGKKVLVK